MKRDVKRRTINATSSRSKTSGSVRIISGQFRGRKLPVLDVQGLRPTTDKNKEMLFNWLMPYTNGAKCLDVFAGSGGLGFEALSRFAKSCTFIELDKQAARKLAENIQLLNLTSEQAVLMQGSAQNNVVLLNQSYDVIFLDPPFYQNLLPSVIQLITDKALLAVKGVIYIECEGQGSEYSVPANWHLIKEKQHPQILSRLYQRVA